MRLTLPIVSSNPDLEPADQLQKFRRPSMLAGYDMKSRLDFSGNDNTMAYTGTFGAQGAVLDGTRENSMTIPISATNEMSMIFCVNLNNIAAGSEQKSFMSCLDITGATEYIGSRLIQSAGSNFGFFMAVDGTKTEKSVQYTFSGAWTVQTIRWKQVDASTTQAERITHGLAVAQIASPLLSTPQGASPIYLGGIPPGVTKAGSIVNGTTGVLGMAMFYSEYLDNATAKTLMDNVSSYMLSDRNVTVP